MHFLVMTFAIVFILLGISIVILDFVRPVLLVYGLTPAVGLFVALGGVALLVLERMALALMHMAELMNAAYTEEWQQEDAVGAQEAATTCTGASQERQSSPRHREKPPARPASDGEGKERPDGKDQSAHQETPAGQQADGQGAGGEQGRAGKQDDAAGAPAGESADGKAAARGGAPARPAQDVRETAKAPPAGKAPKQDGERKAVQEAAAGTSNARQSPEARDGKHAGQAGKGENDSGEHAQARGKQAAAQEKADEPPSGSAPEESASQPDGRPREPDSGRPAEKPAARPAEKPESRETATGQAPGVGMAKVASPRPEAKTGRSGEVPAGVNVHPLPGEPLHVVEETTIRGMPARILSDGSIEAQLPEGWLRFENHEHLDEYLDALEDLRRKGLI